MAINFNSVAKSTRPETPDFVAAAYADQEANARADALRSANFNNAMGLVSDYNGAMDNSKMYDASGELMRDAQGNIRYEKKTPLTDWTKRTFGDQKPAPIVEGQAQVYDDATQTMEDVAATEGLDPEAKAQLEGAVTDVGGVTPDQGYLADRNADLGLSMGDTAPIGAEGPTIPGLMTGMAAPTDMSMLPTAGQPGTDMSQFLRQPDALTAGAAPTGAAPTGGGMNTGAALGAASTAYNLSEGNTDAAAMSAAQTGLSFIPGWGWVAAAALPYVTDMLG